jgi:hypothetical protein
MTRVRRSRWLDERAVMLLARLGEYEMTLPDDVARELISDHLDTTAELMRIGRQAAKFYVTDDVIGTIADQILGIDRAANERDVVSLAVVRWQKNRR